MVANSGESKQKKDSVITSIQVIIIIIIMIMIMIIIIIIRYKEICFTKCLIYNNNNNNNNNNNLIYIIFYNKFLLAFIHKNIALLSELQNYITF